jgi:hypothetical protein
VENGRNRIAKAVRLFDRFKDRIYWRSEWAGPWGVLAPPKDMLDIIRFGREAVNACTILKRRSVIFIKAWTAHGLRLALLDPEEIQWLSPIPEPPPLYIFLSGKTADDVAHGRRGAGPRRGRCRRRG